MTSRPAPVARLEHVLMFLACAALVGVTQCRSTVNDAPVTVSWSVAGLPPTYVGRRLTATVPPSLVREFDAQIQKAHFFDLPADLGGNPPEGRDMGTFEISITSGGRSHTVRFSDATATNELAALRAWLSANLAAHAAAG